MSISQAMFSGVTGLSVNSDAMSVIANNIANANSKGFKADRAEFDDLLSVDLGSGSHLGRGARLSNIRTLHTQGGINVTDNLTDLALQGQGFFVVKNQMSEVQESGGNFFTRVGSFHFDKNGYLSDNVGGHLQGFMANPDGSLSSKLGDLHVATTNLPPSATKSLNLSVQLDSREPIKTGDFDVNDAEKTSNFNTTVDVNDSQGRTHQMTVYFKRMDDDNGPVWNWYATVDGKEVTDAGDDKLKQIASGQVKFDTMGHIVSQETNDSEANFAGGALPGQKISFNLGIGDDGKPNLNASTCNAAKSTTIYHTQDGYEAGNLKTLKIELDGKLHGVYTNGLERTLGAVAVATFQNQDGLVKAGRNQFYATSDSGPANVGLPQTGTRGSIYSSSLEESNVDLATQFVNMIMTQRAFQANSRSVTTTDTMIEEIVNLKR